MKTKLKSIVVILLFTLSIIFILCALSKTANWVIWGVSGVATQYVAWRIQKTKKTSDY